MDLATRAGFHHALATLHHLRGDYAAALAGHLRLGAAAAAAAAAGGAAAAAGGPLSPQGSLGPSSGPMGRMAPLASFSGGGRAQSWQSPAPPSPASAFDYVRRFLEGGAASAAQRAAMYSALLAAAPQLVAADALATAQVGGCGCGFGPVSLCLYPGLGVWAHI